MSSELNNNFDPAADIRMLLSSGETILWSGSPKKGLMLRPKDAFLIPFSIFWFGFACFWEYTVLSSGIVPFALFGLLFVFVGFMFFIGRFFVDAWIRARTIYAITESRLIIVKPGLFSKTNQSTDIKSNSNLSFTQKSDGSGSILFGNQVQTSFFSGTGRNPFFTTGQGFEAIPQVKTVYDIILKQRSK